jgi:hypothetical protein
MMKTVTALFDTFNDANRAINDLVSSGISREEISLISNNAKGEYNSYFDKEGRYLGSGSTNRDVIARDEVTARTSPDADTQGEMTPGGGAAAGAGIGAAIGGVGGLLLGLGLLAIPGVGPALAAGPIVSALVGAGIGGASGGLAGLLANSGIPKEHSEYYAEGVRRGGHLVVANVSDEQVEVAQNIFRRYSPADMDERVSSWRASGWRGYDPNAGPYGDTQRDTNRRDSTPYNR